MSTDLVLREEPEDGILVLRLNRPESLNALNSDLVEALHRTLTELADDRCVRAVVLTGSGRAFCAGSDLKGYGGKVSLGPSGPNYANRRAFRCPKSLCGPWPRLCPSP